MSLEIFPSGPLKGTAKIPGDRMLSLSTLLFAMITKSEIEIFNISDSSDVLSFIDYLCENGAKTEKRANSLAFKGSGWNNSLIINEKIPKEILHQILASCVFICDTVTIEGNPDFMVRAGYVLEKLAGFGIQPENIRINQSSIVVESANYLHPEEISAAGQWEFELYSTAAFSKNSEIKISHSSVPVDYILKHLDFFGYGAGISEIANSREKELMRRMKRLTGDKEKPPKKFLWHGKIGSKISIPGDTVLAAAICAVCSMIEKSKVEIKNVLWENGRRGFFELMKRMKSDIEWQPAGDAKPFEAVNIKARWSKKEGITISFVKSGMLQSEVFILASAAATADGETVINGLSSLFDESKLQEFARKMEITGARIGCFPDGLILDGIHSLPGGDFGEVKDKEIFPALAVAGTVSAGNSTADLSDNNDYYTNSFFRIIGNLSGPNTEIRWNE